MKPIIKLFKIIQQYIGIFLALLSSFFLLMILTSLIPSSSLKQHLEESIPYLQEKGERILVPLGYKTEGLFIYTDEIMLNTAYSIDSKDPIYSFMTAKKDYVPEKEQLIYQDLGRIAHEDSNYYTLPQQEQLRLTLEGKIDETFEYARYWHGYLVFLRPLLLFFNYQTLTLLSAIFFIGITACLIYLIAKKIRPIYAIGFFLTLLATNIPIASFSLNEILCYDIAIIASIFLLLRKKKTIPIPILFFILGGITSFLDFLTNPLVALGIPMLVYLLSEQETLTAKEEIKTMIFSCISWGIGYFSIWIAKWILMDLFYGRNLIQTSIDQVLYRMLGGVGETVMDYTLTDVFHRNLTMLHHNVILATAIVGGMIFLLGMFKNKQREKITLFSLLPYIAIFCFPIVWMILLKNHSFWHYFFVYRIFSISIFAFFILIANLSGFSKEIKESKKEENK